MPLVGTISGSNSTSSTAITGTLVIANTSVAFPRIPPDAALFVSGSIGGGSKAVVGGDLVTSGSITAHGGSITTTATTFNLINNTAATVNFAGGATSISFGSSVSTASFRGDLVVDDRTTFGGTVERVFHSQSAGGGVSTFDLVVQSIFYVNNPASNITANFNNAPLTEFQVLTPTVILSQSATPRIVSAVQVNSVNQAINWTNGLTPTGTAGKQDVFGFSLIRSGSTWKVLGQMSTYG
jgi:hypothetical protein